MKNTMNSKFCFLAIVILLTMYGCKMRDTNDYYEKFKNEILITEDNFKNMVRERGMAEAFIHFASEDAVLSRNNKLIKGKEEIEEYFNYNCSLDPYLWTIKYVFVNRLYPTNNLRFK